MRAGERGSRGKKGGGRRETGGIKRERSKEKNSRFVDHHARREKMRERVLTHATKVTVSDIM